MLPARHASRTDLRRTPGNPSQANKTNDLTCLEGAGVPLPFAGGCLPFLGPVARLISPALCRRPRVWKNACAGSAAGRVNRARRRPSPASHNRRRRGRLTQMLRAPQCESRSLLIRRVTTKPSNDQSNAMAPPNCASTVRFTNLLPKPSSFEGATTGGPPRSVHITTISSS
jgi:hypothetical protein